MTSGRTCNQCGWVHFGVTREFAEGEVARFNAFYDTQTPEVRAHYGNRKSSIAHYERCNRCGNPWTNFRDFQEGDCPDGCTIGPILEEGV